MKLSSSNENALLGEIKKIFVSDSWDYSHTLSAVKWIKEIIRYEGGNEKILITTMYLHDIGYFGALKENYTLDERIEAKKKHMFVGADMARGILSKLDYSPEEINKIVHLIEVHDNLDGSKSNNESKVIEADSLAQIDYIVGNNFGEKDFAKYVRIFEKKRFPRIITSIGKKIFEVLAHENKLFLKYTSLFKK
ncbi:MAG: HD domain-containing protein [archaeon]|jgi:HD superfamily phosphodiesterase